MSSTSIRSRPKLDRNMSSNSVRSRPLMTDFSEYRLHPVRSEGSLRVRDPASPPHRPDYASQDANPVPTPHNSTIEVDQVPTRGSYLRLSETPSSVARRSRHSGDLALSLSAYGLSSITVVAGEQTLDKQEFQVDETLIRSNSGFFNRGFMRREFLNDEKPETIKLPKTSAKVFQVILFHPIPGCIWTDIAQVYLGWINARQISLPTPLGPLHYSAMPSMPEISETFDLLIDCYEAGKKLQDNDFKDVILDSIIQLSVSTRIYPINCIRRIYDMTDAGSAFRRLIVDMAVHAQVPEWWGVKENRVCVTEEALWDIVGAVKVKECAAVEGEGEGVPAFIENSCEYHHHRFFKRPCYKEKFAAVAHPLYRGLSGRIARE